MSKSVQHIEKDLERLWRLLHQHIENLDDTRRLLDLAEPPVIDPGFQTNTVTTMENRASVVSPDIGANLVMPSPAVVQGVCPGLSPQTVTTAANYVKTRIAEIPPTIAPPPSVERIYASVVTAETPFYFIAEAGSFSPGVPFRITGITYYTGLYEGTDEGGWAAFHTLIISPDFTGDLPGGWAESLLDGWRNLYWGGTTDTLAGYGLSDYRRWVLFGGGLLPLGPTRDIPYSGHYVFPEGHQGGILFQVDEDGVFSTKMRDVGNAEINDDQWAMVPGQLHTADYPSDHLEGGQTEGAGYTFEPDAGHLGIAYQACHEYYDSDTSIAGEAQPGSGMHQLGIRELWWADDDWIASEAGYNNEATFVIPDYYISSPENGYPVAENGHGNGPLSPVTGNATDRIAFLIEMDGTLGGDTITGAWIDVTWEPL